MVNDIVLGFGEEVERELCGRREGRGEILGEEGRRGSRVGVVVVEVRVERDRIVVGGLMRFLCVGRSSGRDIDMERRKGPRYSALGDLKAIASRELCSCFSGVLSFLFR